MFKTSSKKETNFFQQEFSSTQNVFGYTPNKYNSNYTQQCSSFMTQSLRFNSKQKLIMTQSEISSNPYIKKAATQNISSNQKVNPKIQSKKTATLGDRFIPLRKNNDHQYLLLQKESFESGSIVSEKDKENSSTNSNMIINNAIIDSMLPGDLSASENISEQNQRGSLPMRHVKRLLSFSKLPTGPMRGRRSSAYLPKSSKNLINDIKEIYENNMNLYKGILDGEGNLNLLRKIPQEPEKILDAPQLADDFYLNILDWGNQNILSVCLGNVVYLWNGTTGHISSLNKPQNEDNVCSVSFMNNGTCLAVGLSNGITELWDIEKNTKLRNLDGHTSRISGLDWSNYLLTTGGKDSLILNHDVRIKEHTVHKLINGHSKEVCSIKWDTEGNSLASGGNDNLVYIWDIKGTTPKNTISIWNLIEHGNESPLATEISPLHCFNQHEAAVKALAWSPWQRGVLATGGGKKDHTIKFWNTETGNLLNSYDTGSQVCALVWNKFEKEIISSHGYSKNQITVWTYPKMSKIVDLLGHMNRVLYLTMSPDGCTLVSGSSDETLRFWNINDPEKIKEQNQQENICSFSDLSSFSNIR